MNFIGLDIHSATFTLAYVNGRGKLGQVYERPTGAKPLIEVVSEIRGPKQLVVEESHLAQWTKHTLEAYVDRLIVCDPRRNKWIAEDDFANDKSSAIKLAKLLQGGYIKEIRHSDDDGAALRSTFLHYYDLNHQVARFKNKLKATFRQVAIRPDDSVYIPHKRLAWVKQLKPYAHLRHQARHMADAVDMMGLMKQSTYDLMVKKAKAVPVYRLLLKMPGVGPVIATGYIAILDTPHRFSRKNKLWRYACLGNRYHKSDDDVYSDGSSKTGNRVLKWLVMQHFAAAVVRAKKPNKFKAKYQTLQQRGLGRRAARRHVCRSLLSSVRAIWTKEEPYRESHN